MTSPHPGEPNVQSGGEQETTNSLTGPHEGRETTAKSQEQLNKERADEGHDAGPRKVSQAEREGMSPTDANPSGPLGVGAPGSTQGNEQMYGSSEEALRAERVESGVGGYPKNKDPESPTMIPGDQGS